MQIDSALSSTRLGADRAAANSLPAANDATAAQTATSTRSAQDDAVHISAEGAAAADQDGNTAQEEVGSDSTTTDSAPAAGASAVQSFAYGTLGLERPDQPHDDSNAFYTAGRWLAAGITVGGIVSLLV
ncbi:hypothetical protein [Paraburkholderia fynbosensis]|uniref:Uncharacterized protein n=1 Tax=Paraburkholderia fynbosensis TaxID=1200993 RepID=A0A6J5H2H0_9BURK|nr:hypothetical protein [Paraburkholderia fynbosensis]CAB3810909.1 hypothetical protein LMG27177_07587 [Paraburkholderia fynbosensis]